MTAHGFWKRVVLGGIFVSLMSGSARIDAALSASEVESSPLFGIESNPAAPVDFGPFAYHEPIGPELVIDESAPGEKDYLQGEGIDWPDVKGDDAASGVPSGSDPIQSPR